MNMDHYIGILAKGPYMWLCEVDHALKAVNIRSLASSCNDCLINNTTVCLRSSDYFLVIWYIKPTYLLSSFTDLQEFCLATVPVQTTTAPIQIRDVNVSRKINLEILIY